MKGCVAPAGGHLKTIDMKQISKPLILTCLILVSVFTARAQSTGDPVKEAQRLARVAQVAQQQGRFDDAIKAYQTITVVAASSPRISASAHLAVGNIYMMTGKFAEAAAAFRKVSGARSELG